MLFKDLEIGDKFTIPTAHVTASCVFVKVGTSSAKPAKGTDNSRVDGMATLSPVNKVEN